MPQYIKIVCLLIPFLCSTILQAQVKRNQWTQVSFHSSSEFKGENLRWALSRRNPQKPLTVGTRACFIHGRFLKGSDQARRLAGKELCFGKEGAVSRCIFPGCWKARQTIIINVESGGDDNRAHGDPHRTEDEADQEATPRPGLHWRMVGSGLIKR